MGNANQLIGSPRWKGAEEERKGEKAEELEEKEEKREKTDKRRRRKEEEGNREGLRIWSGCQLGRWREEDEREEEME